MEGASLHFYQSGLRQTRSYSPEGAFARLT
jgi:hypothetical protein